MKLNWIPPAQILLEKKKKRFFLINVTSHKLWGISCKFRRSGIYLWVCMNFFRFVFRTSSNKFSLRVKCLKNNNVVNEKKSFNKMLRNLIFEKPYFSFGSLAIVKEGRESQTWNLIRFSTSERVFNLLCPHENDEFYMRSFNLLNRKKYVHFFSIYRIIFRFIY